MTLVIQETFVSSVIQREVVSHVIHRTFVSPMIQETFVSHVIFAQSNQWEFYGPVNMIKVTSSWSVYLTTLFLGTLSPLSG